MLKPKRSVSRLIGPLTIPTLSSVIAASVLAVVTVSVPLSQGVTTGRLGVVLLFLGVILLYALHPALSIRFSFGVLSSVVTLCFIIIYAGWALSHSRVPFTSGLLVWATWAVLVPIFLSSVVLGRYLDPDLFLRSLTILSITLVAMTWLLLMRDGALLNWNPILVRYYVNSRLPGGINRFSFGLFFLLTAPVAAIFRVYRIGPVLRLLSWAAVVVGILIGALLGSRQFVVGMALVMVLLSTLRSAPPGRLRSIPRVGGRLVLTGFIAAAVLFLLESVGRLSFFTVRMVATTVRQLQGGGAGGRGMSIRIALDQIREHPFLGMGPGGLSKAIGRSPDTSLLGLAAEVGLPAALALLCWALGFFVWSWRRGRWISDIQRRGCFMILFAAVLITWIWFIQLNDLLHENMLWMATGLIVGVLQGVNPDRAMSGDSGARRASQ